jgi:lipoprotein-anchoring transpeptidase ErfK/SrfK
VHGVKVLIALGVASGSAVIAQALRGPDLLAVAAGKGIVPFGQTERRPLYLAAPRGLPAALVGYDDQAIPVGADTSLIAEAQLRLASAALPSRGLTGPAMLADPAIAPSRRTGGPGAGRLAFDDGTRIELANVESLYASIFPWQGHQVGLSPSLWAMLGPAIARAAISPQLVERQPIPPGDSPRAVVPELPSPGPLDPYDAPRRPAAHEAPYDAAIEPGYDPADASGLSQPASPYFIRVNKTYRTLTLYRDGKFSAQYPVTIGKGAATPDGRFTIANKVIKPPYQDIPGGDPRNPLGNFWLGLDVTYPGGRSIGLHGTNAPQQLGEAESAGCIRLRNEDVEKLYELIPPGTPVEII